MFEYIVLGIIQGITEWLPVSSKSMIILAEIKLFGRPADITDLVRLALFLHTGTFLAALFYLRNDVQVLFKTLFGYDQSTESNRKLLIFIITVTLISGFMGLALFTSINRLERTASLGGRSVMILVGVLLLVTGAVQIANRNRQGLREVRDLTLIDGLVLGVAQGLAAIPGFSRSGLTVAALLVRKFDDEVALRLSFLVSLPIVLAGNIVLNLDSIYFSPDYLIGAVVAFLFGYITMDWLLRIARRVNFGYFMVGFAVIVIISTFF